MFVKNSKLSYWEKNCERERFQFAEILTDIAIYARAAVISKLASVLVVEYPKKGKKDLTIKRDVIPIRNIRSIKYYSN